MQKRLGNMNPVFDVPVFRYFLRMVLGGCLHFVFDARSSEFVQVGPPLVKKTFHIACLNSSSPGGWGITPIRTFELSDFRRVHGTVILLSNSSCINLLPFVLTKLR